MSDKTIKVTVEELINDMLEAMSHLTQAITQNALEIEEIKKRLDK